MRLLLLISLISSFLPSLNAKEVRGRPAKAIEGAWMFDTSNGTLRVRLHSPIVYLSKGGLTLTGKDFVDIRLAHQGRQVSRTASFFEIDGKAVELTVETIGGIKGLNGLYQFDKAIPSEFVVTLGEDIARVPVEIRELDFALASSADEVIRHLGLPTSKKKISVFWPDLERHDGVIYNPDAGKASIVEHWRFSSLPHAVFSIEDGKVRKIASYNDALNQNLIDEEFSALLDRAPLAGLNSAEGNKDNALDPAASREWKFKNDRSFEGKISERRNMRITLQLSNGKELRFNVDQLIDEQRELAMKFPERRNK